MLSTRLLGVVAILCTLLSLVFLATPPGTFNRENVFSSGYPKPGQRPPPSPPLDFDRETVNSPCNETYTNLLNSSSSSPSAQHAMPKTRHPVVDRTFLLMKTGIDVAFNRIPPHQNTTFTQFPHHAVYAETNDTIDGTEMVDCLQFLPTETLNDPKMQAYRLRRQSAEERWNWVADKVQFLDDPTVGWTLDRFKNVPAFAHAWVSAPNFDWYVMVDADTYILGSTLEAITKDKDPRMAWYFGKSVGKEPAFAHGGSGIVFSRGAMESMYGSTSETVLARIAMGGQRAGQECCGDAVMSFMFSNATEVAAETMLETLPGGLFQGGRITSQYVVFDNWCQTVGTFHHIPTWDVPLLYEWELSKGLDRVTYADFYHDFIMPDLVPEKLNWMVDYVDDPNEATPKRISFKNDDQRSTDKLACVAECEGDEDCTMWLFIKNQECTLFQRSVALGKAMNPYSSRWKEEYSEVVTGYMVDRIAEFRQQQSCSPATNLSEGWRYSPTVSPGEFHLESTKLEL